MGYKLLVIILVFNTDFFFHLNLSSSDKLLSPHQNETTTTHQQNDLNESWHTALSDEVSVQMERETIPEQTNQPTFQLSNRFIYPSQTNFREFIAPTLNSETICNLYQLFHSKNPSILHQQFLPPERFFQTHLVFTIKKDELYDHYKAIELEKKILYNFQCSENPHTQFSKFKPILYNPIDKTLESIHPRNIRNSNTILDGCVFANIENRFYPFRTELNTKPFGDENKTVMIARCNNFFLLILEDSTNKNSKQYSVICRGTGASGNGSSVNLYTRTEFKKEHVVYPEDINFILKAKYISGFQKYFFKFQYGHIQISIMYFKFLSTFGDKLSDFSDWVLDHDNSSCIKYLTLFVLFIPIIFIKLAKFVCKCEFAPDDRNFLKFFGFVLYRIFEAYIWIAPYKVLIGALFSPLYFYYSPKIFFLSFNLEPLMAALFWGPTIVYRDLQLSEGLYQIYPLHQMFAIPTLKASCRTILREFFFAWFVMFVLTSFVYFFVFETKMPGEFLE